MTFAGREAASARSAAGRLRAAQGQPQALPQLRQLCKRKPAPGGRELLCGVCVVCVCVFAIVCSVCAGPTDVHRLLSCERNRGWGCCQCSAIRGAQWLGAKVGAAVEDGASGATGSCS